MSGTVIVGSGGGHHAVKFLANHYPQMTAEEKADAVEMLRNLVASVNKRFDKNFDIDKL